MNIVTPTPAERLIEPFALEQLALAVEVYPDAFIAGGYLRDRLLGFKPKDIDIFTFEPLADGREALKDGDAANSQGGGPNRITSVEQPIDVLDAQAGRALYPVQIIHLNSESAKSSREAVGQFAFGLMQILYDHQGGYVDWTQAFKDDIDKQRFTVWRCNGSEDAFFIYKKYGHLSASKFKKWPLCVPKKWAGIFEQYAKAGIDYKLVEDPDV